MSAKLDGRSQEMVRAQLMRRAAALLGQGGAPVAVGTIETAVIAAAARMFEEVTRRLDKVPEKQTDNFYVAMGIGRDPAQPARVPVAIKLSDTAPSGQRALAGTQLSAETTPAPTIFETAHGIALMRGKVSAVAAADFGGDAIYLAPAGVTTPVLPAPAPVTRTVRGAAGAGATVVQVDPALGLEAGMTIRFTASGTPEYDITEVKNDVVTFTPALAGTVAAGDPLFVVDRFVPFGSGARDHQGHALYLSHEAMLDVPGAIIITVTGVETPQAMTWEWFGENADGTATGWQAFRATFALGKWSLEKPLGKPAKTLIGGRNALWIRGRLTGASSGASDLGEITLSVSSGWLCESDHTERCVAPAGKDLPAIAYDAVAVTTPVVPNKPYYPFGREPRLYDAFYVGCSEAFGKAGAEVSLCLSLGGPSLQRIAAATGRATTYLFGFGTDAQLYAARFGSGTPTFSVVPAPQDGGRPAVLPQEPHLSVRIDSEIVRIAVGGIGAVYVTQFMVGMPLVEGQIVWTKLPAATEDAAVATGPVFASSFFEGSVHAMVGTRLQSWQRDMSFAMVAQPAVAAHDLIVVQGADAALLVVEDGDDWRIDVKLGEVTDPRPGPQFSPGKLPAISRAAWSSDGNTFHVAGYGGPATDGAADLKIVKVTLTTVGTLKPVGSCPFLPITFEPPLSAGGGAAPVLLIATATPTRFVPRGSDFKKVPSDDDIGSSNKTLRQIIFSNGRAMVQHWDDGLLYRPAAGNGLSRPLEVQGMARQVVDGRDVPGDAAYFADDIAASGGGYLVGNPTGDRLLLALTDDADPLDEIASGRFLKPTSEPGTLDTSGGAVTLLDAAGNASKTTGDVDLLLTVGVQAHGIWHLDFDTGTGKWDLPASPALPVVPAGVKIAYQVLGQVGLAELQARDYFAVQGPVANTLRLALASGPLRSVYDDFPVTQVETFGIYSAIRLDHDLIDDDVALLTAGTATWTALGPGEPANPALSWEYWNGASWWALDTEKFGLSDRTANLQISQGVYFKAPPDLEETDVGGRKNLWIRARLVGGDYGEARVTVSSAPNGRGGTDQTVNRDVSAIRAPYVISLKIGYCVSTPVKPEIVVTADNLGTFDQTNANAAGLPVTIFSTIREALAAQAPVSNAANMVPDCCRDEPAAPATGGDDDPGKLPTRALMIGFDQPIDGGPLSLFVDAEPVGDWTVAASIYRAGRFETARVLSDGSGGLGESGVIAIEIGQSPDRMTLFGTSAYWLMLTPLGDAPWSPQLRGVHLNGVVAVSVETRINETLGTSSGAPGQTLQLFAAPVDPDSLVLRVAEPVGDEEATMLGAETAVAGMPGPWVPWTMVDEFPAEGDGDPARLFTLDAESGTVTFGTGRNALVPPMGAAVLAVTYRHVAGTAANAVSAGDQVLVIAPLSGIDRVTALTGAAGGADVQPAAAARSLAPDKLVNGGLIVTLSDIERHVRARSPTIAQARAENWRGGVRLIVVGTGSDPLPPPSVRKAIAVALRAVASYGSVAPGRMTVVPPRLLPIVISLTVEPDPNIDYVGLEDAATKAIFALCDHETGGFDGAGWPVGTLPGIDDVAAVLASLGGTAVISDIVIARSNSTAAMPDPFPADVLVTIDRASVQVSAYKGATA